MKLEYRAATPSDAAECVRLRTLTRENAITEEQLAKIGITPQSWAAGINSDQTPGFVCTASGKLVGYCFGASESGEVLVLALLPKFEYLGIGRQLLSLVVSSLLARGHERLFLGCSPESAVRSYGFYRHLGWRSTGAFEDNGDEVLEFVQPAAPAGGA